MLISEVATPDWVENIKASNHGYYGKRPWWLGVRGARMGDNELQSIWWANLPSRLRQAKSRNWVLTREPRSVTDMRFDGWTFTKCRTEESVGDIKSKWQIYKRGCDKHSHTLDGSELPVITHRLILLSGSKSSELTRCAHRTMITTQKKPRQIRSHRKQNP